MFWKIEKVNDKGAVVVVVEVVKVQTTTGNDACWTGNLNITKGIDEEDCKERRRKGTEEGLT